MGHSTGSGARRGGLPRDIQANTRFARRWIEARDSDPIDVVRDYAREIEEANNKLRRTKNGFRREAISQEIDRLEKERRRIERDFLD